MTRTLRKGYHIAFFGKFTFVTFHLIVSYPAEIMPSSEQPAALKSVAWNFFGGRALHFIGFCFIKGPRGRRYTTRDSRAAGGLGIALSLGSFGPPFVLCIGICHLLSSGFPCRELSLRVASTAWRYAISAAPVARCTEPPRKRPSKALLGFRCWVISLGEGRLLPLVWVVSAVYGCVPLFVPSIRGPFTTVQVALDQ